MNDLDSRLAARFARIEPPADFDARLAARLAAEQQRDARHDRAAELQAALQQHERHQAQRQRELRAALGRWFTIGAAGLVVVAATASWWQGLGRNLAGEAAAVTGAVTEPLQLALVFGLPLLLGLAAALRPRRFVRTLTRR
jgi:negative regulator of sigma E activity